MQTYVLTLLHYNLQYCAGGLEGVEGNWPMDEASIEDQIITESFNPILDLLEAHPSWTFSLEMQGYMIEVIAERHPETLAHLQALNAAGQVELVSFHWSDQLWTAFPWREQEVSLAQTRQAFEGNGLTLSEVVFTQEGQFGPGMLARMPEAGYRIAVLPKNLGEHFWGAEPEQPIYQSGDVLVIPGGRGVTGPDGSYQAWWSFLDDGELLATNDANCYLGALFVHDPEAVAEFEAGVVAAEAGGALISGIQPYVEAVEARGTTPLPPVLDGTWQPDDTENLGLWMGNSGLWGDGEADNAVRTLNVRARHAVAALEVLVGAEDPDVIAAWREVLLGQVSDATGWNPYYTEVEYGLAHSQAALDIVAARALTLANGAELVVDVATGQTVARPSPVVAPLDSPPLSPTWGEERTPTLTWTTEDGVPTLTVDWVGAEGDVELSFPWDGEVYALVPALLDTVLTVPATEIVADPLGLPLPAGLLRLSDGVWLVAHTDTVHLAARFSKSAGVVRFLDETTSELPATWRFSVITGTEDQALAFALTKNVYPTVVLAEATGVEGTDKVLSGGCGCASGPGTSGATAPLLALVALLRWRGSRRRS